MTKGAYLAHGLHQAVALHVLLRLARKGLHRLAQRGLALDRDQPVRVQDPEVGTRILIGDALRARQQQRALSLSCM
jgi:hypothetical protein